jgi:hypothetical protein
MSLQDLAALTVVFSFLGGIGLWAASRMFVTRSDMHELRNKLSVYVLQSEIVQNDVRWIKAKLSGDDIPNG